MRILTLPLVLAIGAIGTVAACSGTSTSDAGNFDECSKTLHTKLEVNRPANAPTEFRIERCQVDVDACLDLCGFVATQQSALDDVTACTAQFIGDDKVELQITYFQNLCPVEGPVAGGEG